jgi:hypothetical protein
VDEVADGELQAELELSLAEHVRQVEPLAAAVQLDEPSLGDPQVLALPERLRDRLQAHVEIGPKAVGQAGVEHRAVRPPAGHQVLQRALLDRG